MNAPTPRGASGVRLLRRHPSGAQPKVRLVCFPHAGAAPRFFTSWARALPQHVELVSVRYSEAASSGYRPDSLSELAETAATELGRLPGRQTVLFGHSMGAIVAYETALRCPARIRLRRLIASASPAPDRHRSDDVHLLDDDALMAELLSLGGTDSELFAHQEARVSWLPVVRSDYRLINTYEPNAQDRLDCPITAFVGTDDQETPLAQVRPWRENTASTFELRLFAGGHFYLQEWQDEVLAELRGHLNGWAATPSLPAMP